MENQNLSYYRALNKLPNDHIGKISDEQFERLKKLLAKADSCQKI